MIFQFIVCTDTGHKQFRYSYLPLAMENDRLIKYHLVHFVVDCHLKVKLQAVHTGDE